jgi:hypothetical protein
MLPMYGYIGVNIAVAKNEKLTFPACLKLHRTSWLCDHTPSVGTIFL